MVSKRNFFSIVIMMGILLFLFQFSLLMKDSENEYNKNDKLAQSGEDSASAWEADEVDLTGTVEAGSRYVIYIGSENEELKDTVSQWCLYTKSGMAEYAQVADCPELPEVLPQMIVLESGSYQTAEDIAKGSGRWRKREQGSYFQRWNSRFCRNPKNWRNCSVLSI